MINSSCKSTPTKKEIVKNTFSKPKSNFQDTLIINVPAAVFYYPDSLQLLAIKATNDEKILESTIHEFHSQIKNAHTVLNKDWRDIKIIEAKNVRYLLFKKKNQDYVIIDLNTKGDSHGLYLFSTEKDPQLADMMNIDTQLYFYFSK